MVKVPLDGFVHGSLMVKKNDVNPGEDQKVCRSPCEGLLRIQIDFSLDFRSLRGHLRFGYLWFLWYGVRLLVFVSSHETVYDYSSRDYLKVAVITEPLMEISSTL